MAISFWLEEHMQVGEILVSKGVITQDQLDKALAEQKASGLRLGEAVAKLGFASAAQVEAALK